MIMENYELGEEKAIQELYRERVVEVINAMVERLLVLKDGQVLEIRS